MDLGLEGKVAVVTGAGAGIGLAVCRALAAEGMRVVGASRRDPEEVVDGVEHHRLDLTEAGAVESLVESAVDRHGSLAAAGQQRRRRARSGTASCPPPTTTGSACSRST